jgi:hypothetical protein
MKAFSSICVALALCLTGCGKSQNPPANNSSSVNPLNAASQYGQGLANSQNKAVGAVDIASLNQTIQLFQVQEGRFPKDLNELVDKKLIGQIPDAPRGQKLQYDAATGTVSLVPAQ